MQRSILFAAVLFLVVLGACQQRAGPDVAWRQFVEAARKGDEKAAWPLLSKATQDELTRAAVAVAEAEGQKPPKDGRALMFQHRSSLVSPPTVVEAVFEGDDAATVNVLDEAGERGSVRAVREDGRWRFDLTQQL